MAYQRFGTDSDLYIWMGGGSDFENLNIWVSSMPKTPTVKNNNGVEIVYGPDNIDEAATLFCALHDLLKSNGVRIDIDKKRMKLKGKGVNVDR